MSESNMSSGSLFMDSIGVGWMMMMIPVSVFGVVLSYDVVCWTVNPRYPSLNVSTIQMTEVELEKIRKIVPLWLPLNG